MNEDIKKERMLELLADRALFGLNEREEQELKNLQAEFPAFGEDASFEHAAAAIGLVNLKTDEEMPPTLQTKILADADKFFAAQKERTGNNPQTEPVADRTRRTEEIKADIRAVSYDSPKPSFLQWLGWGIAAFACIALVANIWLTRFAPGDDVVVNPTPTVTPQKEPTLAEQKQNLLASAGDIVRTDWSSPDESGELSGEIVWSDSQQRGYMTFRNLPVNDKSKETYQLWIFDETQSEKTPISGGIFDVEKTGEVIVPVDPNLKVRNPKMFAVTIEKPGGVMVSDRGKIAALAKVQA
jgi:hypothetical protein